jgi:hypothetical protein
MNDYVNEQMSLLEKTIEKTRVNVKASPKKRMSKIINLSIAKYKPPVEGNLVLPDLASPGMPGLGKVDASNRVESKLLDNT